MANHQSAKKRIRQDEKKRLHNRYYKKSTRTAIRKVREMENYEEAAKALPALFSMIDRLAKRRLFHPNKAANLKSSLSKHVNRLA